MVTADQVISMIQAEMPNAEVNVNDLTGGGDHFEVTVVSEKICRTDPGKTASAGLPGRAISHV